MGMRKQGKIKIEPSKKGGPEDTIMASQLIEL